MKTARTLLGLATLVAGVVIGIYLWSLLNDEPTGHTVTIVFEEVEGLEVGASVRYRGVPVGEVRAIRLGANADTVEAICMFEPSAEGTLRATSRFWIVRPRFLGVARGASGLETLVKDSYIAYTSPDGAERLPPGAYIPGLPGPPSEERDSIGHSQRGDLEITVLFQESGQLERGAPVRYRGLEIGIVKSVDLARDGKGVVVAARVEREHRAHVSDRSKFWVARPTVEAGWLSGLDVQHLESLLGGVHLAVFTPSTGRVSPARDDARFLGSSKPPELNWAPLDPAALDESRTIAANGTTPAESSLVRVHYSFDVRRWWAKNPSLTRRSTGVTYRTVDGLPAVLVARSAVDANWSKPSAKGDVRDRAFRVELHDGSVVGAGRVWVAPNNADLAVLILDEAARIQPARVQFEALVDGTVELASLSDDGNATLATALLQAEGSLSGVTPPEFGSVVLVNHRPIAIAVGNTAVGFDRVPASLRSP